MTIDTNRSTIKWGHLILPSTPLPTTSNSDCTQCDPQSSLVPSETVGAFEGARYFHCGIYRPEFTCKMRALGVPFCAVCQEVIRNTFSLYLISVNQIRITVTTGNKDINKGDRVYLGIAGREFRCRRLGDRNANPFHLKNHAATLTFSAGSNVEDAAINDPRDPAY